jgi:hypothetical protein
MISQYGAGAWRQAHSRAGLRKGPPGKKSDSRFMMDRIGIFTNFTTLDDISQTSL